MLPIFQGQICLEMADYNCVEHLEDCPCILIQPTGKKCSGCTKLLQSFNCLVQRDWIVGADIRRSLYNKDSAYDSALHCYISYDNK